MAKAQLFSREVAANKSPRNAFNMSYSTLFNSPAGQILPTYVQEVQRGDKLILGATNLTRTIPLVTPAFMSFDEKTDFWFVPYRLLWSDWENWKIGQTYQYRTTNLKGAGIQNFLPFTTYSSLASALQSMSTLNSVQTSTPRLYYEANGPTALRYLDLLGYSLPKLDSFYALSNVSLRDFYVADDRENPYYLAVEYYKLLTDVTPINYFRLAAFQCIYMHGYRNEEYEVLDPSYYNMDNLFQNLQYDNSINSEQSTLSSPHFLTLDSNDSNNMNRRISWSKLFTPRFKNWRRDVFTSAHPDAGFNLSTGLQIGTDTSAQSNSYGSAFYWSTKDEERFFTDSFSTTDNAVDRYNPIADIYGADVSYDAFRKDWTFQYNGSSPANVVQQLVTQMKDENYGLTFLYPQNVRNLMAQDKFSRSVMYADKNLSSQIKALFGEEYVDPHRPIYLGSYSNSVQIDDVTATADGVSNADTTSIVGQLAGKVKQAGQDGKIFEREFKDDGVVIGVHYVMPRNNYDSYRINKWNTKLSRFDFFFPQFDGLGFQPLLAYERNLPKFTLQETELSSMATVIKNSSSLYGFSPRYYEYKQRTNEVHGSFQAEQPDFDWTLTNNPAMSYSASDFANYKISPYITNRIFQSDYDGSPAADPFQHYYYYDVTLVSNMEVYGTPSI